MFNAADWRTIDENLLTHITGLTTFDIITLGDKNLAIVIGDNVLYQYDYSDVANMKELSVIPVIR